MYIAQQRKYDKLYAVRSIGCKQEWHGGTLLNTTLSL